jgi:hypothetical protein
MTKNNTLILYLFTAGGFAFILAELFVLGHFGGPRIVGVVSAGIGIALGVLGAFLSNKARRVVGILFILLALTGAFGFISHSGTRGFRANAVSQVPQQTERVLNRALNSYSNMPPTLSPLALSGLSILGAMVSFMASRANRE